MSETGFSHQLRIGMDALANRYRQHRKTINENLGLMIALAASGAAIWTGYEARHARLDARTAAEQSLKVQQDSVQAQAKSVDAQITAMRLDERPYVRVTTVGIKRAEELDRDTYDYRAVFNLVVFGRTPATLLTWNLYCGLTKSNQIVAASPRFIAEHHFTRTTSNMAVLNNADSLVVDCPFSRATYQSGTDDVYIDPDKQITEDRSSATTFIVDVIYSDVFTVKHRTQQCFYVPTIGTSPMRRALLSCHKFKPIIE